MPSCDGAIPRTRHGVVNYPAGLPAWRLLRFDSAGAGGWLCPVGAPMTKRCPPGGEGLSHTPADGGVITLRKERCCLRSSTVGGRGPFSPPGYVRRSEDRFCEPPFQSFQGALSGVRVFGQDYLGAGIFPPRNQNKVEAAP